MSEGNELLRQLHAERSERQASQLQLRTKYPESEPEPEVEQLVGHALLHVPGGTRSWSGAEVSVSRSSSLSIRFLYLTCSEIVAQRACRVACTVMVCA
jgi:hypothetical protein